MSHLNSNENQIETNYTAVEMIDRPEPSSRDSRFKLVHIVVNSLKRYWNENGTVKLIITALGIFLSYIIVGFLQEKIMRGCYNDETGQCERFPYALTLVGVQFIFSFTFIKVLDIIKPEEKDTTHFLYYTAAAAANASAMVSSTMALKWVTFPMQVIFKSAKPISVMISGLLICKRYAAQRYLFVLIIVIGVVVFKFFESDEGKKPKKISETNEIATDTTNYKMYGTALLILSLTMDGILGAIQDRIREVYAPTSRQFMIGMSACGAAILIVAVIVTGEIKDVHAFTLRHPEILWHICTFAVVGVIGQLFIYTMVACFGSLACSVTTTVRKFFSVLFSIIFFGNPSTPLQWLGAVLVFAGLFADAFFGKKHTPKKSQNETDLKSENAENSEVLVEKPDQKTTEVKSNTTTKQNAQELV